MNRARKKINWKFDRRAARLKFGYKKNSFKRSTISSLTEECPASAAVALVSVETQPDIRRSFGVVTRDRVRIRRSAPVGTDSFNPPISMAKTHALGRRLELALQVQRRSLLHGVLPGRHHRFDSVRRQDVRRPLPDRTA